MNAKMCHDPWQFRGFEAKTATGRSWPKITIVTPSFNHARFLEAAILSVLSQGYPNLEYIIMDGGSSDESVEIIEKYKQYLCHWASERDDGQYDAISKGFAKGTGDILAWLNSDDMYCPWALRTVGEVFANHQNVHWLTSLNPGVWDYAGNSLGFGHIPGVSREHFLDGNHLPPVHGGWWIQQESTFWRSDLFRRAGGLANTPKLAGDFDLWCRFFDHEEIVGIGAPLAGFRLQDSQRSRQMAAYTREASISLGELRRRFNYRRSAVMRLEGAASMMSWPRVKRALHRFKSYPGMSIRREFADTERGHWALQPTSFRSL